MEKAVEIRMADKDKIGIFLSGGLDSRLIAGFAGRIANRTNKDLISFTFGTKGGWQERIARQVAECIELAEDGHPTGGPQGHLQICHGHDLLALDEVRDRLWAILFGSHNGTVPPSLLDRGDTIPLLEAIRAVLFLGRISQLLSQYVLKLIPDDCYAVTTVMVRMPL